MEFKEKLSCKVADINDLLDRELPKTVGPQQTVADAMRYSVMAGGKRLRPMLMQEVFNLFGGSNTQGLQKFMVAIECIHSYSLVHDDLPAMDDDEYRRGRKTTHIVYGEAMGVLAGDALLNYAFEVASGALSDPVELQRAAGALTILAKQAGIYGMVGGQVVDVESEGKKLDQDTLDFIHEKKTCALIQAAMTMGAVLAGAAPEDVNKINQAGYELGMAFQIQDDLLDVIGDQKIIGKPVGSDEKNEKFTYVTLLGIEGAKAAVRDHSEMAIGIVQGFDNRNPFLEQLMVSLIDRQK